MHGWLNCVSGLVSCPLELRLTCASSSTTRAGFAPTPFLVTSTGPKSGLLGKLFVHEGVSAAEAWTRPQFVPMSLPFRHESSNLLSVSQRDPDAPVCPAPSLPPLPELAIHKSVPLNDGAAATVTERVAVAELP